MITRLAYLVAIWTFFSLSVPADDLSAVMTPKAQSPRGKSEFTQRMRPKKAGKPDRIITYSGFLADLSRTNHPAKWLNLRKPLDPMHDLENVHLDMRTGRPNGFRLFSLDF